jgi:hypothetical protein
MTHPYTCPIKKTKLKVTVATITTLFKIYQKS